VVAGPVGSARVVGAGVAVVAVGCGTGHAFSRLAHVAHGARVSVRARGFSVLMKAAAAGEANVLGARLAVVAFQRPGAAALTLLASISGGALVEVVAPGVVGFVNTALPLDASIVGADVAVFTGGRFPGLAASRRTFVSRRAGVSVITRVVVVVVGAAGHGDAFVIRTRVVVVAVLRRRADAHPAGAFVLERARVHVVANAGVVGVQASEEWVAYVLCALVVVFTIQLFAGLARSVLAVVVGGALVAVAAGCVVVGVKAAGLGVARIIRARVAVVASEHGGRQAQASFAMVAHGALVAVVAPLIQV